MGYVQAPKVPVNRQCVWIYENGSRCTDKVDPLSRQGSCCLPHSIHWQWLDKKAKDAMKAKAGA